MALTKLITDLIDGSLGTDWQATPKTANFTAVAGEGYFVDTASTAITVTLPSSPTAGDEVSIIDYGANASTNNITITSSDNIEGAADDLTLSTDKVSKTLVYSGTTKGWLITTDGAGGTSPNFTADYLVVAGGGGAGYYAGAGGGAGGLRTSYGSVSPITLSGGSMDSPLNLAINTNYTVTIGGGGSSTQPTTNQNVGGNGSNSVFSTITSTGGGGGGGGSTGGSGADGGSGGGSSSYTSATTVGGNAVTSPVIQGFKGGDSTLTSQIASGGGGAGAAASNNNKNGGVGLAVNILNSTNASTASIGEISGSDVYFAGGGGSWDSGVGGLGGGGDANSATSGEPNTGGGAGGDVTGQSGSFSQGNSGVVILRYPSVYSITVGSGITEASGSPFTEGSDKVSIFTAGTGNISFS